MTRLRMDLLVLVVKGLKLHLQVPSGISRLDDGICRYLLKESRREALFFKSQGTRRTTHDARCKAEDARRKAEGTCLPLNRRTIVPSYCCTVVPLTMQPATCTHPSLKLRMAKLSPFLNFCNISDNKGIPDNLY